MTDRSIHPAAAEIDGLHLRAVVQADEPFLFELYASTREEELAVVDWPESAKTQFLRMQFEAQSRHYRQHYPGATLDVIEIRGEPVGRLYVHRGRKDIRIMDIALLPAHRGRGLGTALLRTLMAEAEQSGRSLSIHVEIFNPARRLYQRLGFVEVDDVGVYKLMEYRR